jgi:hypothetical protein
MRFSSVGHRFQAVCGAIQPHIQWVPGSLPSGVKRPVPEPNHLPLSSVEVMNAWNCTSIATNVCMARFLVTHRISLHGLVLNQTQEKLPMELDSFAVDDVTLV